MPDVMDAVDRSTNIGGHPGMLAYRENGVIVKRADNEFNELALHNEARMLRAMEGSGYTPRLLEEHEGWTVQEDVGVHEPMRDGEVFRRNCIRMLHEIRRRDIRHGDLTAKNIILRNDYPWVIDWQEGHFLNEKAPQKQPFSDTHLLFRTIAGTVSSTTHVYDTPRVARRWLACVGALGGTFGLNLPLKGKTFLDLGCFQGDFVAAASLEGMEAYGIDQGGFRTGEDSIAIARTLWPGMAVNFFKKQIMELGGFPYDVVMMFSTWAYIVRDYGRNAAEALLQRIIGQAKVFFFETQLHGDGPGPDFLPTDEAVAEMLGRWGSVKKLITIPVWGRPASRTVWMVQ